MAIAVRVKPGFSPRLLLFFKILEYIVHYTTSSSHYIYTFLLRRLHEAIFIFFIHWKYTICIIMSGNLSFDVSFARNPSSEKLIKKELDEGRREEGSRGHQREWKLSRQLSTQLGTPFQLKFKRIYHIWATIVDRTLFGIFMKCESSILTMTA